MSNVPTGEHGFDASNAAISFCQGYVVAFSQPFNDRDPLLANETEEDFILRDQACLLEQQGVVIIRTKGPDDLLDLIEPIRIVLTNSREPMAYRIKA